MSNVNNQIIFILDDDTDTLESLKKYISSKISSIEIYTFNTYDEMRINRLISKVSLFIIDINLKDIKTGDQVAIELHQQYASPFLLVSGLDYDYDSFDGHGLTYDFIKKPIIFKQLINRIKVLLKVSETYNDHINEKARLTVSLRELFDYTNIYLLILDDNMKVKLCSYKLWKDLGYNSEEEIIGLDWKEFLMDKDKDKLSIVHTNVIEDTDEYQHSLREVTNKLITNRKSTITVKWFNSRIVNSHTYSFSIGIPYNRIVTEADEIESIRAYWKHVIEKDETTLKALKQNIRK